MRLEKDLKKKSATYETKQQNEGVNHHLSFVLLSAVYH